MHSLYLRNNRQGGDVALVVLTWWFEVHLKNGFGRFEGFRSNLVSSNFIQHQIPNWMRVQSPQASLEVFDYMTTY